MSTPLRLDRPPHDDRFGPIATRRAYDAGCECQPCSTNASQMRLRSRFMAYKGTPLLADSTRVQAHVRALLAAGIGTQRIARAAGVSITTVHAMRRGDRPKIRVTIAAKLLAVPFDAHAAGSLVPIAGSHRRLQALAVMGWTLDDITARAGRPRSVLEHIRCDSTRQYVTRAVAADIARVYDELAGTIGPSSLARTRARNKGWPSPLAWDDDTIDDPTAQAVGIPRGDRSATRPLEDLLEDWRDTRDHHHGSIALAAPRLGMTPGALVQALRRARRRGIDVGAFVDDTDSKARAA